MSDLHDLLAQPAFAIIRSRDSEYVTLIGGPRHDIDTLDDIPAGSGGPGWSHLVLVPFRQVRERGFAAHDDGTPLSVMDAHVRATIAITELIEQLPDQSIEFTDMGGFEASDDDYAATVRGVIDSEIGAGAGANVVIARRYTAQIADWGHARALSVLRRLLTEEHGSFWTFCIFTGERWLIGASPERHVSVDAGQVRMNPISGTLRMRGLTGEVERNRELVRFLSDEKEIYELFMVVDEELKMMCDICHEGGLVLGPYLKAMTHVMHTEYLLAGRTNMDVREVLRKTMFAATVTGSPVKNACRIIHGYEHAGRGYYGAVAALIGADDDGQQAAEAPILIRMADVDTDGNLTISAGATLVRDSDAEQETAETRAKASGVLAAFGLIDRGEIPAVPQSTADDDVLIALGSRNQRLSRFWLADQADSGAVPALHGTRVLIIDGEDDFVNMLRHILGVLGSQADLIRYDDYYPGVLDGYDLVVVGPGPGDPRDDGDPKIARLQAIVDELLEQGRAFLAVCLGFQVLCRRLGFPLAYKDIVFQGTQKTLPVLDRNETVGFYNTFAVRPRTQLPDGVDAQSDPETGDVHLIDGPHFSGIQFHAESILTQNGEGILADVITRVQRRAEAGDRGVGPPA